MDEATKIRKFSLTATLLAMECGQVLNLTSKQAQPQTVYNAALRLKKDGRGEYEVHRSGGDSRVIRLR